MPWWGIVLLVVGVQAAFLLVYWLLTRSKPTWAAEFTKLLAESGATRLKEELEAEQEKTTRVEQEMKTLAAEYKEVAAWYTKNRERIDDEAKSEFDALVGNPSALDSKLDKLLGGGRSADDAKPGLPVDPATTAGEG